MSSHTTVGKALRGDVDPLNLLGIQPSNAEIRGNREERRRRASQIELEKSQAVKDAGGLAAPATRQIGQIRRYTLRGNSGGILGGHNMVRQYRVNRKVEAQKKRESLGELLKTVRGSRVVVRKGAAV